MSGQQSTQGVIPPPPGITANFEKPERKHDVTIYVLSSAGIAICTLCIVMRIYTKSVIKHTFGIEDIFIILAWIFSLATQGIMIYSFAHAGEGMHLWDMSLPMFTIYQKVIMAASIIYVPCQGFAKLSLLFLYHRLSPQRPFRIVVYIIIGVVVGYSFPLIFILIFSCRPIQKGWDAMITEGTCVNRAAVYIATAVVNIVTDLFILIIPIPMVAKLQMPRRQKLGVVLMFVIGSATVVTSVVRLVTLLPMLTDPDISWAVATPAVWIIVEANLVIICGCLPAVRQFLRSVAPRLIGESSSASHRYCTGKTLTNNLSGSRYQHSGHNSKSWTDRNGSLSSSKYNHTQAGRTRLSDDADLVQMRTGQSDVQGGTMRTTETTVVSEDGHLDKRHVYDAKNMWGRSTLKNSSGSDDDGSEKEIIKMVPVAFK